MEINPRELVDAGGGRIDPRVYTSQQLFEAEMDRIFRKTWVYVGHESQVAEPGQFRTCTIGTRPLVLSRGQDGGLYVFENSCAHRGALVCAFKEGTTKAHRCEYHGWTYGPDGGLLGAPFWQRYANGIDREKFSLRRLPRVESYQGLIFASFSPDVPSLDEHLGAAKRYIDAFCGGNGANLVASGGSHQFDIRANWKVVIENIPDGYHASATHKSMVNVVNRHLGHAVLVYADGKSPARQAALGNGHTMIGVDAMGEEYDRRRGDHNQARVEMSPGYDRAAAALRSELGEERFRALSRSEVVGPGMLTIIYPNLALAGSHIREITPISLERTVVSMTPLLRRDAPDELNELRLRVHEFFFGTVGFATPDDVEMFERTQAGAAARTDDMVVTRGLGMEEQESDGKVVGSNTDETGIRAQYQEWLRLMTNDEREHDDASTA